MPQWRRGIVFEMHERDTKIVRYKNVKSSNIVSYTVVKDPSDVTVVDTQTAQDIELAVSNADEGSYEIGPLITFANGEIQYFPATFEVWD